MKIEASNINTWQQGRFIDQAKYSNWSEEEKQKADNAERYKVRPSPKGNVMCECNNHEDAKWIASRLNLAAELEELTYNFFAAKENSEEELINYVRKNVEEG